MGWVGISIITITEYQVRVRGFVPAGTQEENYRDILYLVLALQSFIIYEALLLTTGPKARETVIFVIPRPMFP